MPFLAVRLSGRPRSALLWEEASARKAFVRRRATSPTEHADGRRDGPAGNAGRAQHRPGGGGTPQSVGGVRGGVVGGRVDGVKPRQSWPAASAARRASPHVIFAAFFFPPRDQARIGHLAAPAANAARRSRDFGNAAMLIFPATLHRRQFRRLLLSLPLRAHTRALPTTESQSPPHEVFYCAS